MGSHNRRQFLSMAGEFLVAGELNRRWIPASITFGGSKRADIFAYRANWNSPARIEVKTTDKGRWLLGLRLLEKTNCRNDWFWVLVHIPRGVSYEDSSSDEGRGVVSPRYFIFTSEELGKLARTRMRIYRKKYKLKHGREYSGTTLPNVRLQDVANHEGAWRKIQAFFL